MPVSVGSCHEVNTFVCFFFTSACMFCFVLLCILFLTNGTCQCFIFSQESVDLLLLDLSTEIDSNQNCVKGNPFTKSSSVFRAQSSLSPENPFTAQLNFFPTPSHDPFRDDPFSKSNNHPANQNSNSQQFFNGNSKNGDSDYLGQQFDQLSNRTMVQTLSNDQWALDGRPAETTTWTQNKIPEREQNGHSEKMTPDPFLETAQNGVKHENGSKPEAAINQAKDSIIISPPPLNTKAGRGRRGVKVRTETCSY